MTVFKDLSKNFAKINLIWSDPWRGKQDVENIVSVWLNALQICQLKGRFGSTERIQRRKNTKRRAPWVITTEVAQQAVVLPAGFGSETTDVCKCKVANTAMFGRQGGDGRVACQDQFCSGGIFCIIATYCSPSAVGSSSLPGGSAAWLAMSRSWRPNVWRAWNLRSKEKWGWEALETSLGIMHSFLLGYTT